MIELHNLSTKFEILSGPGDLFNERLFRTFSIPFMEKIKRSDLQSVDNVVPY